MHDQPNKPSKFWKALGDKNRAMLAAEGMENFKRTVANNYFNWAVLSVRHGLFWPALKHWLAKPNLIPFKASLPEMDLMRKQQSSERLKITLLQRHIYRLYVALAWSVMIENDPMKLHELLSEPEVGNPFQITLDGKWISQDLANSIIECNTICSLLKDRPLRVAEIGGGYGRLAYVFSQCVDCEYTIFDIEPTLSVATWYLGQTAKPGTVRLYPADTITDFAEGYFDIVLSISTLPEMSPAQVTFYLAQFRRLARRLIFLKQWQHWTNPEDGTELRTGSYEFGRDWKKVLDVVDPLNAKFFNCAWSNVSAA